MPLVFDTLAYARRLADAGVPDRQAEAHAEALAAAIGEDIVRRRDLEPLATKADLAALERRTDVGLASLETRLTMRVGAMMVAAVGVISAVVKLL